MTQAINKQVTSLMVQKYLNSTKEKPVPAAKQPNLEQRASSANDDAAGVVVLERMNTEIRGMNAGIRNAYDGISASQVAENGLQQVSNKLQRMRDLALRSANGNYSSSERQNMNREFSALNGEIAHIASSTKFTAEPSLANTSASADSQAVSGTEDTLAANMASIKPLNASITTVAKSLASISRIDSMIASVASSRASFGAVQSHFESTINDLQAGVESQSAARVRLVNADSAIEMAMRTGSQIVEKAELAMSSQANVSPDRVKQLSQ